MSENNLNLNNEVRYIYGDQEYILGEEEVTPELRDILCADGTRAILVDGQYIVADQTILLQDSDSNLTQFYINDNSGSFVIDGDETTTNSLFETTECVQLVDEDTNDVQQIIYYTNDDSNTENFTSVQELGVDGIQDEEGNIYPFKRIKLEGQLLNFDEFVQQQATLTEDETTQSESLAYTILDDGTNINSTPYSNEESSNSAEKGEQVVDLSKITGRNLITGQTVTLHSYMEKLKKRLNKNSPINSLKKTNPESTNSEIKKPELSDLLDKKISIGTTKSGKKIVGKIIHVEKRDAKLSEESQNNRNKDPVKILLKKPVISADKFDQICKTLGGVMEMESVRKKIENKNIIVKLIEKKYNSESDSYIKNTSYSYGYMEQEFDSSENLDKWKFVTDPDFESVILGDKSNEEKRITKFPVTTSLTILITYEKTGNKSIRVNLNPQSGNQCTFCSQYFKNNNQLRHHMQQTHLLTGNAICEVCEKPIESQDQLQEHQNQHVQEGKLFICSKCNKCFTSQAKLQKHIPTHDVYLRPLECTVCEIRCASEWALKKHLLTHTGMKPFSCDICNKQFMTQYDLNFHKKIHFPEKHFACNVCMRTFSRHSNLLRHAEIHKGAGSLYKCEICYCSYNYISSLTRHMVQNHLETNDFNKKLE